MNELRRRVDALRRRMARELAIKKAQDLAREFCMRWHIAVSEHKPLPNNFPFIARINRSGLHLPTLPAVNGYLDRCRSKGEEPLWERICQVLLPWAAALHMTPPPLRARTDEA